MSSRNDTKNMLSCMVCGAPNPRRRYNAINCKSCASFFQKMSSKVAPPECKFDSDCEVIFHNRAWCKSCRYQKCLTVGMRRATTKAGTNPQTVTQKGLDKSHLTMKMHQSCYEGFNHKRPPVANVADDPLVRRLLKSKSITVSSNKKLKNLQSNVSLKQNAKNILKTKSLISNSTRKTYRIKILSIAPGSNSKIRFPPYNSSLNKTVHKPISSIKQKALNITSAQPTSTSDLNLAPKLTTSPVVDSNASKKSSILCQNLLSMSAQEFVKTFPRSLFIVNDSCLPSCSTNINNILENSKTRKFDNIPSPIKGKEEEPCFKVNKLILSDSPNDDASNNTSPLAPLPIEDQIDDDNQTGSGSISEHPESKNVDISTLPLHSKNTKSIIKNFQFPISESCDYNNPTDNTSILTPFLAKDQIDDQYFNFDDISTSPIYSKNAKDHSKSNECPISESFYSMPTKQQNDDQFFEMSSLCLSEQPDFEDLLNDIPISNLYFNKTKDNPKDTECPTDDKNFELYLPEYLDPENLTNSISTSPLPSKNIKNPSKYSQSPPLLSVPENSQLNSTLRDIISSLSPIVTEFDRLNALPRKAGEDINQKSKPFPNSNSEYLLITRQSPPGKIVEFEDRSHLDQIDNQYFELCLDSKKNPSNISTSTLYSKNIKSPSPPILSVPENFKLNSKLKNLISSLSPIVTEFEKLNALPKKDLTPNSKPHPNSNSTTKTLLITPHVHKDKPNQHVKLKANQPLINSRQNRYQRVVYHPFVKVDKNKNVEGKQISARLELGLEDNSYFDATAHFFPDLMKASPYLGNSGIIKSTHEDEHSVANYPSRVSDKTLKTTK